MPAGQLRAVDIGTYSGRPFTPHNNKLMQSTILPSTSVRVSRIGFGTASLTSLSNRSAALNLLNLAFDAGITHFDTARLYGFGHAEGIVGEFLNDKRDAVTVATKFGLEPPTGVASNARFVSLAKRILKRVPGLASRVRRRAQAMVTTSAFTPDAAARSLERSLRELRTDRVDLFMLHECTLADAAGDDLLAFLEAQISRGTVREIGIATAAERLQGDVHGLASQFRVIQLQNNLLDPQTRMIAGLAQRGCITHSALKPRAAILDAAAREERLVQQWLAEGGPDPRDGDTVARLLLSHALAENPAGAVLFATTRPERILTTIEDADSPAAAAAAMRFAPFARRLVRTAAAGTSTGAPFDP